MSRRKWTCSARTPSEQETKLGGSVGQAQLWQYFAVMKDHIERAKQLDDCTLQDLTPKALDFLSVLDNSIIPSIQRDAQMIRIGVVPQYKARNILAVNIENQIDKIDPFQETWWLITPLKKPLLLVGVVLGGSWDSLAALARILKSHPR